MDELFSVGTYLHDLFISRFSSFPLFLSILIIVLLFSVIGVFEICIYIVIGRLAALYKKTREANLEDRIIVMLANVLVYSDSDEPHIGSISNFGKH